MNINIKIKILFEICEVFRISIGNEESNQKYIYFTGSEGSIVTLRTDLNNNGKLACIIY